MNVDRKTVSFQTTPCQRIVNRPIPDVQIDIGNKKTEVRYLSWSSVR